MSNVINGVDEEQIYEALRDCYDPEIPVNIVDLGLVYGLDMQEGGTVKVTMTLTAIGCPVAPEVMEEVATKVRGVPGVNDVYVELTFDPPWTPDKMSEDARWELGMA